MVLAKHGVTIKKVTVVSNQRTNSTYYDVIREGSQVEEMGFALLTTQLWTRDLPFCSPFADIIWVVFPCGNHHDRQGIIGPANRPYDTATRGCTVTVKVV